MAESCLQYKSVLQALNVLERLQVNMLAGSYRLTDHECHRLQTVLHCMSCLPLIEAHSSICCLPRLPVHHWLVRTSGCQHHAVDVLPAASLTARQLVETIMAWPVATMSDAQQACILLRCAA